MTEIAYSYLKKRCDFGRQPLFCERGPELCDSVPPDLALHKAFILRNPVHQATQHTPPASGQHINTIRAEYSTTGINHAEGGWPKDVNVLDPEATQRYRRKIEKDDNYIHCVMTTSPGMEHNILQNNAIDMYHAYYVEMNTLPEIEHSSMRTVNVYRDPTGRSISSLAWAPDSGGQQFAATYVDVDMWRNSRGPLLAMLWDVERPNHPEVTLAPPVPVLDLRYNPREPSVLAAALMSGQVATFDRRKGGPPVSFCPPHVAHRDLVRGVIFINSKTGQEMYSSGPDGACKWWDLRNLSEPTDEMIMDVVKFSFETQTMANSHGVSVLEYEPTIPTRFMVGTEDGLIIGGNRKGKSPTEKLPLKYDAHNGPLMSLERNPGFLKNFLSVGDWTARVWSEECRESAVLWSPPQRHKITAGTWSPGRLSLMALTQWDGVLSLWDLLRRQHCPVLTMQLTHDPLLRLTFHEQSSLLLAGSKHGDVFLVELSSNLAASDNRDKQLLTSMFERESKRERILEARMREIRLKQRQAEEGEPVTSSHDLEGAVGDRDLQEATAEYLAAARKEIANM